MSCSDQDGCNSSCRITSTLLIHYLFIAIVVRSVYLGTWFHQHPPSTTFRWRSFDASLIWWHFSKSFPYFPIILGFHQIKRPWQIYSCKMLNSIHNINVRISWAWNKCDHWFIKFDIHSFFKSVRVKMSYLQSFIVIISISIGSCQLSFKTPSPCKTLSGSECVFPFTYQDQTYYECTR